MTIKTNYDPKPIPDRRFDWTAIDDETYDGADDARSPIGFGNDEGEAIADLKEQLEEAAREAGDEADDNDPDPPDPAEVEGKDFLNDWTDGRNPR